MVHAPHATTSASILRILLTHIISVSSLRVRENRESFISKFKLLFVSAFVRVMGQALFTVSFLELRICTLPGHTQNLVIILGLAPLESRLGFLEFRLERS